MNHIRRQIRDYVEAGLRAFDDVSVDVGRTTPYPKSLVRALNISIVQETSANTSMDGGQERMIALRVEAAARAGSAETENTLDDLCARVEGFFAADPQLGGLIATYEYRGTDFATGSGDTEFATASMLFALVAFTRRETPAP